MERKYRLGEKVRIDSPSRRWHDHVGTVDSYMQEYTWVQFGPGNAGAYRDHELAPYEENKNPQPLTPYEEKQKGNVKEVVGVVQPSSVGAIIEGEGGYWEDVNALLIDLAGKKVRVTLAVLGEETESTQG